MKSFFYASQSGKYRYWLKRDKLMIQIKTKDMEAFRASPQGRQLERHVEILKVGGGWWAIYHQDGAFKALHSSLQSLLSPKAGHKVWIAGFNQIHLSAVNANPQVAPIAYVKKLHTTQPALSATKLTALVAHFN